MAAIVGRRGPALDAGGRGSGQAPADRQQGSAGDGRSPGADRAAVAVRRHAHPDRQRAQRHLPVPAGELRALGKRAAGVRRIMLTASGGPFRSWSARRLPNATPEQACAHPTWSMGRKISVDSATLMNKGLELIEAQLLFGLPVERHRRGRSTRRASCTRWSNTSTARCWRSWARPTCARRSRRPWRGRSAWPPVYNSSICCRSARLDFEAPGPAAFSVPGTGHRGGARGCGDARRAERRQRGGRGGLPGRAFELCGISEQVIGEVMNGWMSTAERRIWKRCSRPTPALARSRRAPRPRVIAARGAMGA